MSDPNLGQLTREQLIDYMEKRQDATVIRYMRQIEDLEGEVGLQVEPDAPELGARDFRVLDTSQIVQIMETEQEIFERRLQRRVETLAGARRWSCPA